MTDLKFCEVVMTKMLDFQYTSIIVGQDLKSDTKIDFYNNFHECVCSCTFKFILSKDLDVEAFKCFVDSFLVGEQDVLIYLSYVCDEMLKVISYDTISF